MSKYNNEVMLGGFIVLAGGLLAYMSIAVGGFNLQSGVHVKAKFTNASGLVKDAAVSVAGVEVGHVEGMTVDHDKAVVNIFLRKDAGIRADVKAAIRAKSLLGEKYLELVPQSKDAPTLKDGDLIADTRATVEVDELLATLGPLMKEVDPKDVAKIVRGVAKTVDEEQGSLAKVVRNAAEISTDVREMVAKNRGNVDAIAANMASLSKDGAALLTANKPKLDRTMANVDKIAGVWSAESPKLAGKAARIATNVERVTGAVDPKAVGRIAKNADAALGRMPAALDDLSGLRTDASRSLGKANVLLDKANAVDEADVKNLAQDIFLKGGMRIYMHPFQPPEPTTYQKAPVPAETLKP
jgi:ABC-type transporter Mla subunit MlaD